MKLSRRKLLAGTTIGLAAPAILHWPANAAAFSFKCGSSLPDGHPMAIRAREAMRAIKEESGGRLDITLYTNSLLGGDTAMTDSFAKLRRPIDIAIMSIGAYNPWIQSHCTPEQAVEMATAAGAQFIMPVHHQTFRLSFEPFREPIERFQTVLQNAPERIALREIGETFVMPLL